MSSKRLQSRSLTKRNPVIYRLYIFLASRAYSVIILGALFCTLTVKLFHSWRYSLMNEYLGWVLNDVSFLLGIEVILALVCFCRSQKWVLRTVTIVAAVICTWSVMNAGWLLRTGTQILPRVLLPLFRSTLNTLCIIGVNLIKMPKTSVILLGPSAIALTFLFLVLVTPVPPGYNRKRFFIRILVCIVIVISSVLARGAAVRRASPQVASLGLHHNCHIQAIMNIIVSDYRQPSNASRKLPAFDQIKIERKTHQLNHNIVVVVLEGVQRRYTSLSDRQSSETPYLAALARQGVEFSNARSSLTHTTKALFALLSGRFPSASQDIAEAVPAVKPYGSIVTILNNELNYRTAFFQSAMGNFESRPGLVYNLGFDKFWARDDLNDPNSFLGYLASDEFSLLKPITEWVKAESRPFFITILCSATHDPYEVPEWFDAPSKEPIERYRQSIRYTDKFIAALDVELARLNLSDNTVFCVVGDHGEAFGEHGQLGHARIAFDEALRIPFFLRAPFLVEPGVRIDKPVSSVDLAPTLLGLLGFETETVGFDGVDLLGDVSDSRKVYFSGWMREGPVGFVQNNRKLIYNPADRKACIYDIGADPFELVRIELPEQLTQRFAVEITEWRRKTFFKIDQQRTGKKMLFGKWLCHWTNRVCSAKYEEPTVKPETE